MSNLLIQAPVAEARRAPALLLAALGAEAAFAGKAFLWGLGALGLEGPGHVIALMIDEMRAALGQIGAKSLAEARSVVIRHPGALRF